MLSAISDDHDNSVMYLDLCFKFGRDPFGNDA